MGRNGKKVMLNLFQHLIKSNGYETLKRVQGDKITITTQSPKGEGNWNLNQGEVKERLKWKRGLDSSY